MPRRAQIQPRTQEADPVYGSVLVTQLVNRVMLDGKKSVAEGIVYVALEQVADKTGTGDHCTSNDVGLLWPPDRAAPVLVAAYLTEGSTDRAVRDAALAAVGAAAAMTCTG